MDKYKELGDKLAVLFEEGKSPDEAAELIAKTLSCEVIMTDHKNDIVANYGSKIPINCLRYSMKTNGTLHLFSRDPENDDIYQEHDIRDKVLPALSKWFPGKEE